MSFVLESRVSKAEGEPVLLTSSQFRHRVYLQASTRLTVPWHSYYPKGIIVQWKHEYVLLILLDNFQFAPSLLPSLLFQFAHHAV